MFFSRALAAPVKAALPSYSWCVFITPILLQNVSETEANGTKRRDLPAFSQYEFSFLFGLMNMPLMLLPR
jgi:hypothetical protein